MTPSQLVAACADARELDEILEYDALDPPLSRRDLIQLCGDLLAKIHNAHFTNPLSAEDLYPDLRPEDWADRHLRRAQREDQRLRDAYRLAAEDGEVKALKAALAARNHNGQRPG